MNTFQRITASILVASTTLLGMPLSAQAGVVSSVQAFAEPQAAADARAKLDALLAREEVRTSLAAQGLSAEQARARVQALSDDEAQALAGRVDQMPAGGDFLGLLFTVFIVLLVTDILGMTKVFTFTRAIR